MDAGPIVTMSETLVDRIRRRPDEEGERRGPPAGFRPLPGVPAGRYTSAEFARLERDVVFGRRWLFVAHVDQLPSSGDYLAVDHLRLPVVVVRDGDQIRAFVNTCSHRGSALVLDSAGNTGRRFSCPYHNWVYDLDGALVGLPDAGDFGDLDRSCLGLTAVGCETWGPLVFVNLDPAATSLAEQLGPVAEDLGELAGLGESLRLAQHTSIDIEANWKLPVDANIETYHVNYIHKDTAALAIDQSRTGIQLLPNGHSRMLVKRRIDLEVDFDFGFPPLFHGLGDLPGQGTFSYHVFPNLSIVFSGTGFVFFITNWPTGPDTSRYDVYWCSSLDPVDHADHLDRFIAFNRAVLLEDLAVIPSIQRSLDSGAIGSLRLGYQERRIQYVHEQIDRELVAAGRTADIPVGLAVTTVLDDLVER